MEHSARHIARGLSFEIEALNSTIVDMISRSASSWQIVRRKMKGERCKESGEWQGKGEVARNGERGKGARNWGRGKGARNWGRGKGAGKGKGEREEGKGKGARNTSKGKTLHRHGRSWKIGEEQRQRLLGLGLRRHGR